MLGAAVAALAVDRHRRGDQHAGEPVAALGDLLQHHGRADRVDRGVALDLVHRLADADGGGEMDDVVDALERRADRVVVAHVADLELDGGIEVAGPGTAGMHLRVEVVERAHAVAAGQQRIAEVGTDESGTAGDEHMHAGNATGPSSARGPVTAAQQPRNARFMSVRHS